MRISEWSSDVCSSDLLAAKPKSVAAKPKRKVTKDAAAKIPVASADAAPKPKRIRAKKTDTEAVLPAEPAPATTPAAGRSAARRVGNKLVKRLYPGGLRIIKKKKPNIREITKTN